MPTETPRQRLQQLLRELFQFDCADLDFGIYRIMNFRRKELERFIEKDLLDAVAKGFEQIKKGESKEKEQGLAALAGKIRTDFGPDALDSQGNVAEAFKNTPLAKQYAEKKAELADIRISEQLEAELYSDIYNFFSRYWSDGDFLSLRRYSKQNKYAIPYNGEEVKLYWANYDQYYIKTTEYFKDYAFKADEYTVHFKIAAAQTEQNNVKGEKRFFLLSTSEQSITLTLAEGGARSLIILFEYRPLTDSEKITYGSKSQQEKINAEAEKKILDALADNRLKALLSSKKEEEERTLLAKHLLRYTRRNTSDYFIHKDLKGFLERELDFYIKNEILMLDDLDSESEVPVEKNLTKVKVLKQVCRKIIEFLAQLENFQKKLFEKRKFVLETNYCMTIDNVPEEFYDEILANKEQLKEWRELFKLPIDAENGLLLPADDEQASESKNAKRNSGKKTNPQPGLGLKSDATKLDKGWLKRNPTLVLDTKFFARDFKDRLISRFENLDKKTEGVLIKSENLQALNLLKDGQSEEVKSVYIDPPFNTGTNEFLYKNDYLQSSWICMMHDRVSVGKALLDKKGNFHIRIDYHGDQYVRMILDEVFHVDNFRNEIIVRRGRETAGSRGKMEIESESIYWFSKGPDYLFNDVVSFRPVSDIQWTGFLMGGERHPRERTFLGKVVTPPAGQHFPLNQTKVDKLLDERFVRIRCRSCGGKYFRAASDHELYRQMKKKEERYKFYDIAPENLGTVHGVETLDVCLDCGENNFAVDYLGSPEKKLDNLWIDIESYSKSTGFFTENSEQLLHRIIATSTDENDVILDYFLGSATTTAVAQKLRRRWIGIEMGHHFENICVRRMKRVLFGDETGISKEVHWRGGGMFKYQTLESYEDALNNIQLQRPEQGELLEFEDYLLKYMLEYESRDSASLLNVQKLIKPFDYELELYGGGEKRRQKVDLVETFNYLLGVSVNQIKTYNVKTANREIKYRAVFGSVEGKSVIVIWRDTEGWDEEALKRDKEFIEKTLLNGTVPDSLYINGDSFVPNALPIEKTFTERMFAPILV